MTTREKNEGRRSPDTAEERQHARTGADPEFLRRFVTPPDMGPVGFEVIIEGVADFWSFVTGRR